MQFSIFSKCEHCNGKGFLRLGGNEFNCHKCNGTGYDTKRQSSPTQLEIENAEIRQQIKELMALRNVELQNALETARILVTVSDNLKTKLEHTETKLRHCESVLGAIYSIANASTYEADLKRDDLHDVLIDIKTEAKRGLSNE